MPNPSAHIEIPCSYTMPAPDVEKMEYSAADAGPSFSDEDSFHDAEAVGWEVAVVCPD